MMGARAHLLVVLCLLGAGVTFVGAQTLPTAPASQPTRPTPFGRTTSTVIAVAIIAFFFLLLLCAYIIQCRLAGDRGVAAAGDAGGTSRRGKPGLDPAVVATFPIVPYRKIKEHKIGSGVLKCAVCLNVFEGGDDLRLLPHCLHAFHPECIDPWLEARITCPLCRANLKKPPQPAAVATPSTEQTAPQKQASSSPTPPHAVAIVIPPVQDEKEECDEDDRKEEAVELEMLRSERRAARLPRSNSAGVLALRGISRRGIAERPH